MLKHEAHKPGPGGTETSLTSCTWTDVELEIKLKSNSFWNNTDARLTGKRSLFEDSVALCGEGGRWA